MSCSYWWRQKRRETDWTSFSTVFLVICYTVWSNWHLKCPNMQNKWTQVFEITKLFSYSLHSIIQDYFIQFKGLWRTSDFSINHFSHYGLAEIIRINIVTFRYIFHLKNLYFIICCISLRFCHCTHQQIISWVSCIFCILNGINLSFMRVLHEHSHDCQLDAFHKFMLEFK